MKHLIFAGFYLYSTFGYSQKAILVNPNCNEVPVTNLYWGIKNEVCFYEIEKKKVCIDVQIREDSSLVIHKFKGGKFSIILKKNEESKLLFFKLNGNKEYDSLVIDCINYPLKFSFTRIPDNHRSFNLTNYKIDRLYIMDTRVPCDSIINNFTVLKYIIELHRSNSVFKSISINEISDRKKLREIEKILLPGDSLYARDILIKSRLGVKYKIKNYLLRTIN